MPFIEIIFLLFSKESKKNKNIILVDRVGRVFKMKVKNMHFVPHRRVYDEGTEDKL